jgi:hypothetical protein
MTRRTAPRQSDLTRVAYMANELPCKQRLILERLARSADFTRLYADDWPAADALVEKGLAETAWFSYGVFRCTAAGETLLWGEPI